DIVDLVLQDHGRRDQFRLLAGRCAAASDFREFPREVRRPRHRGSAVARSLGRLLQLDMRASEKTAARESARQPVLCGENRGGRPPAQELSANYLRTIPWPVGSSSTVQPRLAKNSSSASFCARYFSQP